MPKVVRVIVGIVAGFAMGVLTGIALVSQFTSNTHDKSMEVVMTAAFVTGPIGAVLGAIVALMWGRQGRS